MKQEISYTGYIRERKARPSKPFELSLRQKINGVFARSMSMAFANRGDALALGRQYVKGLK